MAVLKSEDHFSLAAIRLFVKPLLVTVLCVGPFVVARAQDSHLGPPLRNPKPKTPIQRGRWRATPSPATEVSINKG
jgi:hypothetical protein